MMYCKYFKFSFTLILFCFVLVPVIINAQFLSRPSSSHWRFPSSQSNWKQNSGKNLAPPVSFGPRVWNGNVVPYNISSITDEKDRRLIYGAMQEISQHTCFRFKIRWSSERSYLDFIRGSNCQVLPADITGEGENMETRQIISLPVDGNCLTNSKATQLILSALGHTGLSSASPSNCDWKSA